MNCDVVAILCRPESCKDRAGCELHRPLYPKAENMTVEEEKSKGRAHIRQSKCASLGYPDGNVPKHLINLVNF